jgi:PhzF family phenazine biosynthesis protein
LALKQLGAKVGVAALYQDTSPAGLGEAPPDEGGHSLLISRSNREARAFTTQSHSKTAPENTGPHLEVRAFAAAIGILEDPVTGSLNASLAQWLIASGQMPPQYTASQGTVLERQGRVFIQQDANGQVWVGGDTVVCIEGHVALD